MQNPLLLAFGAAVLVIVLLTALLLAKHRKAGKKGSTAGYEGRLGRSGKPLPEMSGRAEPEPPSMEEDPEKPEWNEGSGTQEA